ncbi:MAG: acetoin utilization protein AcuC [Propionibacteriales bacterium]|nr:acetoin utilization protein AcuC [Propionibacteriales bacterium]
MSGSAGVVFDASLTAYNFGAGHPLAPIRVDLTIELAAQLGVLERPDVTMYDAPVAAVNVLQLVHTLDYIDAVRRCGADPTADDLRHGLGTDDNPTFAGMHEAAAHIVGATVEAARLIWSGEALHGVSISGGLHHALAASASGFCIYNDPAVAIAWLLAQGAERVAYVDIDVHHGDGVQAAFYHDPRVLTISLHETPRTLFPGTGDASESGGPGAEGSAVNVALPPGTDDGGWLRAFHAVVPPLLRAFAPQVLVSQHGCDTHMDDPLAHLMVSIDGQRAAHLALHDLAHEVAGGRWLATGGGGYALTSVVPRTWTHLLAVAAGSPIDPQTKTPAAWRAHVERISHQRAPTVMTDGRDPHYTDWSEGYNPDSWLDRCVEQTRGEVFPFHGIDPSY